jgi:ABC-type transport system involved in multi-copper enzyme maturation permease subunit
MTDRPLLQLLGTLIGSVAVATLVAWRVPRTRTLMPVMWAATLALIGWFFAANAPDDRGVVVYSALLTVLEVGVVSAIATVLAAFSSPFLTAICTFGLFLWGRSADTLAHLPRKVFGEVIAQVGTWMSQVPPNLMLYVPPRALLLGETANVTLGRYLIDCTLYAVVWSVGLLAAAIVIFRRRDFI